MDPFTFNGFVEVMKKIEAEDMLKSYKIHDWPNTKKDFRDKEVRRLEKIVFGRSNKDAKRVTNDELRAILGSF